MITPAIQKKTEIRIGQIHILTYLRWPCSLIKYANEIETGQPRFLAYPQTDFLLMRKCPISKLILENI